MKKLLTLYLLLPIAVIAQMNVFNSHIALFVGNTFSYPAVIATPKVIKSKLPLVISCHGTGEAGSDTVSLYNNGLPNVLKAGYQPPFDFIMVAPQAASYGVNPSWLPGILADIESRYSIDTTRIYITGYSAGGWATYGSQMNVDISFGKTFAAIAPLSAATQDLTVSNYNWFATTKTPVWDIVGVNDVDYVAEDLTVVDSVNYYNANSAYIATRPGIGHGNWTDIYDATYKDGEGRTIWDFFQANVRTDNIVLAITPPKPIVRHTAIADFSFNQNSIYINASFVEHWTLLNDLEQPLMKGKYNIGSNYIPIDNIKRGVYFLQTDEESIPKKIIKL